MIHPQRGDGSIVFSGSFVGDTFQITTITDHGLYTGDEIYYAPQKITITNTNVFTGITTSYIDNVTTLGLDEGLYFVKRVDSNNIKLS